MTASYRTAEDLHPVLLAVRALFRACEMSTAARHININILLRHIQLRSHKSQILPERHL